MALRARVLVAREFHERRVDARGRDLTVVAPLGAALIAGGVVMVYIDLRLRGDGISDRPRRWRFPPPQDS